MRHEYRIKYPEVSNKIKFYIGDVRDIQSVRNTMHNVDYIFHAAALRQVPSCEFFPIEAVKMNVLGTENVLTAAIDAGVKKIICLSTDKAAYPVNAMGTSKAMMDKVIVAKSRTVSPDQTSICCMCYGNVFCSRGSVVPLWIEQWFLFITLGFVFKVIIPGLPHHNNHRCQGDGRNRPCR